MNGKWNALIWVELATFQLPTNPLDLQGKTLGLIPPCLSLQERPSCPSKCTYVEESVCLMTKEPALASALDIGWSVFANIASAFNLRSISWPANADSS